MYPYFLLVIIPIATNLLFVGKISKEKNNRLTIALFFILYFLLLALRSEKIGIDLTNYKSMYVDYGRDSWNVIFGSIGKIEIGYVILCKLIYLTGASFQLFLAIVAVLELLPIAILYGKESQNAILTIVLFLTVGFFSMVFSGVRQSIAVSLGTLAYMLLKEKKHIWFVIVVCIACTIHTSAFILFFLLPLRYMRLAKKWMIIIVPCLVFLFVFNTQIFDFLMSLLPEKYEQYQMSKTNGSMMLILYVILAIFSYVILDEKKADQEAIWQRNILLLSIVIQIFAPIHSLAMRMNYYFIIYIPLLIPKVINNSKRSVKQISVSAKYVMIIFFLGYFFYNAYTDTDILQIYPYQFFWE